MLIDWFTVGAQALNFLILVWLLRRFLYKPILNAIDAREKTDRRRTGRRRCKKGRSEKGARRFPAQERRVRPAARRAPEQGNRRSESRTRATPRRSAQSRRRLERKARRDATKRRAALEPGHQSPNAGGSFCHHAKDAGRSRHDKPRRADGRRFPAAPASAGRKDESEPRRSSQDGVRSRSRAQRVRPPRRAAGRNSKSAQRNLLGRNKTPLRNCA